MIFNTCKIKKKINSVGFYGAISIEVSAIDNEPSVIIGYESGRVDSEWYSAIKFGVDFFFEHYYKENKKGLSVLIKDLHTMLEDSSQIVVFYITVRCLAEALGYKYELIEFDELNGTFHIKK